MKGQALLDSRRNNIRTQQVSNSSSVLKRNFMLQKIKSYFNSKRISILPTTFDVEAIVFFICPIIGAVKFGLLFGSIALLFIWLGHAYIFFSGKRGMEL